MFSHNRRDTAFVRRVQSLQKQCDSLTTFTFRRDGEEAEPGPPWDNIDLGYAEHAQFGKRLWLYGSAIVRIIRHRHLLKEADVIHARNLDIFLFAWIASLCSLVFKKPMVYECLDVHEALTREGRAAALLRWLERRVLSRARLLIISSPGFMQHYFEPTQHYHGKSYLAENKLFFKSSALKRPQARTSEEGVSIKPVTIAWVGIIRCTQTLDLLRTVAIAMPDKVRIKISGLVSYFLIPDFDEKIAGINNITFTGPYDWPHGLAEAYSDSDLVWSQELSWRGHNSDWLIPNRVYEGSFFGVPSLALAGTQTGKLVEERKLGYTLADDTPQTLQCFLQSVSQSELSTLRNDLLQREASEFVADQRDADRYLSAVFEDVSA
jgi:succinoglycan biosynthesis protein ExoL